MELEIKFRTVGRWKENSYALEYGGQMILIDPGEDFNSLDSYFSNGLSKYKYIINTHGHFDHVGAVEEFKRKYDIPFYMHSGDKYILRQANLYRKITGETTFVKIPKVDFYLDEMMELDFNGLPIKIYYLPGHSYGSVGFAIDHNLFSGDLIYIDALGRIDLPGGDKSLLLKSVDFLLNNFEGFMIHPGHGVPFRLEEKIISNLRSLL